MPKKQFSTMASCDKEAPTVTLLYSAEQMRTAPEIEKMRDWLLWSIVNVFLAMGGGLLPLIFSLICRSKKRHGEVSGARTMSLLALVFNIVATVGGILSWILLIVQVVIIAKTVSGINEVMALASEAYTTDIY